MTFVYVFVLYKYCVYDKVYTRSYRLSRLTFQYIRYVFEVQVFAIVEKSQISIHAYLEVVLFSSFIIQTWVKTRKSSSFKYYKSLIFKSSNRTQSY